MNPRAGGPCQCIRNLVPQGLEQGHRMEVLCLDEPNSDYLTQESFPIHALGKGRSSWDYHPALLPWLIENLPRFEAVILNGIWQYPGYALLKATQHAKTPPYFVFPHGMLDPWFQRTPERRFKAFRNWLYWKLIEQHVIHSAEALFFTCGEEMRLALETFRPYQPKRQINVGFGVAEPPPYHDKMAEALLQQCPGVTESPYFLFLGRIHPKKGVDILIEAYSAFKRSASEAGQTSVPNLVIAGPGLETSFGGTMREMAARICPPDSVFWPGMLIGDAKWGALYHSEALVLTSHQENFGIAVAEAMACGKPVLISNQINIWREIEEDKAGLVAADTLEGAENLLGRWGRLAPEDKKVMERAAKASYEKRFGIGSAARNLLATVEELIMHSRAESVC